MADSMTKLDAPTLKRMADMMTAWLTLVQGHETPASMTSDNRAKASEVRLFFDVQYHAHQLCSAGS